MLEMRTSTRTSRTVEVVSCQDYLYDNYKDLGRDLLKRLVGVPEVNNKEIQSLTFQRILGTAVIAEQPSTSTTGNEYFLEMWYVDMVLAARTGRSRQIDGGHILTGTSTALVPRKYASVKGRIMVVWQLETGDRDTLYARLRSGKGRWLHFSNDESRATRVLVAPSDHDPL
ncbi:hypothetical protein BBP40_007717 [Aspergillus hancockii]|nr:hypothetical protein BBP40_007717 [Aspergillus hancockii]